MSVVIPFRALRPARSFVKDVASLPYDVLNRDEARALASGNPLSFLRVEKSEIDLEPPEGDVPEKIFAKARENLENLLSQGIMIQEETPCFYIYRQRMGAHEQTGIVGCASVAEYESGRIKKHELTRADKELERTRHVDTVNGQTGPVFLAYRSTEDLDRLVEGFKAGPPEYDFTADDGIVHTVWAVSDSTAVRNLAEGLKTLEALYIADGHHRAAAACSVCRLRRQNNPGHRGDEPYNYFLSVMFPHSQLRIMDYNRAVRDLHGLDREAFLGKVEEKFEILPDFSRKSPEAFHSFGMYLGGKWHQLVARENLWNEADPIGRLDVSILQTHLLEPVLGIMDPRTDQRIDFIGGIRGMAELERLVDSGNFAVAFSLFPTTLEQLMAVADAGLVMPPKSTWFEPKLRSGLFVHRLA
ncbi:Uncharacterized conserved protein, DUF1015 family [Syntrophus gentianae]|uniref:Uncharacterized conserved protein, DUF1015 family n=1 Tax=Syntrophus gentianae TaxID=43775 RepID=A0A1H8ASK7_9BACT|nr:DUF1015 family protein [Syntrophus gentianae]SEM72944.1 Uncharacterized conserved protein, DUF1015 family [Syntrophus gentianae]